MICYVRDYIMRWNIISHLSYRYLPQRWSSRAIHMSLPKRVSYKYWLKWIGKLHLEMISLVKYMEGHTISLKSLCISPILVHWYRTLWWECHKSRGLLQCGRGLISFVYAQEYAQASNFGNDRNGYWRLWWEGDRMPVNLERPIAITRCLKWFRAHAPQCPWASSYGILALCRQYHEEGSRWPS